MLVDIGGGTTDIAIFKDGIIRHTAVIPMGGKIINDDIKDGCEIVEKQAETLKVKFGSAWPGENNENEVVSIPGLRGRPNKEISVRSLSHIINARMVEIMELVRGEMHHYLQNDPRKKLISGIVLTGGGAELKHIRQLVAYTTGLHTKVGVPNEHLASNYPKELTSPIYATSIGLLKLALENMTEPMAYDPNEVVEEPEEEQVPNETPIDRNDEQEEAAPIEEAKRKKVYTFFDAILKSLYSDDLE